MVGGILLLLAGVVYPTAAVAWLNNRLNRQPVLSPRQLGLTLAFNAIFPVSLIFWGAGLTVPRLWAVLAIRMIALVTMLTALVLFRMLWAGRSRRQRHPDRTASQGGDANGR